MKQLTNKQREKLAAVAKDLMAIWNELPISESEEGCDWYYRGGLVQRFRLQSRCCRNPISRPAVCPRWRR
jgi:hypothetical protein